jgi:hypothetical protein
MPLAVCVQQVRPTTGAIQDAPGRRACRQAGNAALNGRGIDGERCGPPLLGRLDQVQQRPPALGRRAARRLVALVRNLCRIGHRPPHIASKRLEHVG